MVVLSGTPAGIPTDVAAHLNGDKRRMAAARGAVGLITIRTRSDGAALTWQRAGALRRPAADRPRPSPTARPSPTRRACASRRPPTTAPPPPCSRARRTRSTAVLDEAATPGTRPAGFALHQTARLTRAAGAGDPLHQPQCRRDPARHRPGAGRRICAADGPSRPYRHPRPAPRRRPRMPTGSTMARWTMPPASPP